jgi:hypothetical protein
MIPQKDWPVHESHCCPVHGCKYGDDENCPVTNRLTMKYNQHCEDCENEGNLVFHKKPIEPDIPLSRRKLVAFLKSAHVRVEGANDKMAIYGAGRNILADLTLVGIAVGDFEFEEGKE